MVKVLKIYRLYFNLTKSDEPPFQYKNQHKCYICVVVFPTTTIIVLAKQERSTMQVHSPAAFIANVISSNENTYINNILHWITKCNNAERTMQ